MRTRLISSNSSMAIRDNQWGNQPHVSVPIAHQVDFEHLLDACDVEVDLEQAEEAQEAEHAQEAQQAEVRVRVAVCEERHELHGQRRGRVDPKPTLQVTLDDARVRNDPLVLDGVCGGGGKWRRVTGRRANGRGGRGCGGEPPGRDEGGVGERGGRSCAHRRC